LNSLKTKVEQIIILVFKIFSAVQSDLFQNIPNTSPIMHNKGTFNLKTQLGLANQPSSGTVTSKIS
jgi:hypothetical protein